MTKSQLSNAFFIMETQVVCLKWQRCGIKDRVCKKKFTQKNWAHVFPISFLTFTDFSLFFLPFLICYNGKCVKRVETVERCSHANNTILKLVSYCRRGASLSPSFEWATKRAWFDHKTTFLLHLVFCRKRPGETIHEVKVKQCYKTSTTSRCWNSAVRNVRRRKLVLFVVITRL